MISVSSANPEIDGRSSSVNMRSMLWGLPFSNSHAFKPSGTATTVQTKKNILVARLTYTHTHTQLYKTMTDAGKKEIIRK